MNAVFSFSKSSVKTSLSLAIHLLKRWRHIPITYYVVSAENFTLSSRKTWILLPVPEEGDRTLSCPTVSHRCWYGSFQTSSSCPPDASTVHITYFHFLNLVFFFSTDHTAIYFLQRAYDLSFMVIGHRNGKAEGSWKGLHLMGIPLIDRRAGKGKGRASQPPTREAHTLGITSCPWRVQSWRSACLGPGSDRREMPPLGNNPYEAWLGPNAKFGSLSSPEPSRRPLLQRRDPQDWPLSRAFTAGVKPSEKELQILRLFVLNRWDTSCLGPHVTLMFAVFP